MIKLVWITRDWTGEYSVFIKKPRKTKTGLWLGRSLFLILGGLNQIQQKELLGLKRHIIKSSCIKMLLIINSEAIR